MANKKISELTAGDALTGPELFEGVQGGVNKKFTAQQISDFAGGSQDLESVLTEGNDAGGLSITNLDDPTNAQDAATKAYVDLAGVGIQDLYIPAVAMWPRVTGGCSDLTRVEMATSLVNIQTLDFDNTTQEFAQFTIVLPRKWNLGAVTAVFYWTATVGTGGTVQWGISGGAYSDDDALTVALGTAQTVTDNFIALNDLHVTSATAAIILAGTPDSADFLAFQVSRNPGSDTYDNDVKLLGVSIRITTNAQKDA